MKTEEKTALTKLEQQIYKEIVVFEGVDPSENPVSKMAQIAAKIALEVAEKAWYDGRDSVGYDGDQKWNFEDFQL